MWDLPVPFGPKLEQVVVALAIRNKADQRQQLGPPAEHLRVEAHALHQHVHPLLGGELRPRFKKLLEVHAGHLDGLQACQSATGWLWDLGDLVGHIGDAPDATDQQLGKPPDEIIGYGHLLDAEVGELGLIEAAFVVQFHREFINDLVAALFLDGGFDQLRLIAVDVMLGENF